MHCPKEAAEAMNTSIQNVMSQAAHPKPIAAALHQTANHIGKAQRRVTKLKASIAEQREAWATYTSWIVKYHQEQSAEYWTIFTNTKAELRDALMALSKASQEVATLGAAAAASAPPAADVSQDSEDDAELQNRLNSLLTVPRTPMPTATQDQDAISVDGESEEEGPTTGEEPEAQEEPEVAAPGEEKVTERVEMQEQKPPPSYAAAVASRPPLSPFPAARQSLKVTSKQPQTSPARQAAGQAKSARNQKLETARTAEALFQQEENPDSK